jgi:electron transfer flavoprotein beta subunit
LSIVVCIKPVPDPEHWEKITLDPVTKTLRRKGIPSIINPLDKHAIEEALRIKEKHGGNVTVVSMAPPTVMDNLREAIALGVDEAILLSDRSFAGADTLATSYVLAAGIRKLGKNDLVLCGNQSLDGSTGQVGPQVAEFLGVPHVTNVRKIDFIGRGLIRVESTIEHGYISMEVQTTAVLTVVREINTPRYIPLTRIPEAMRREIKTWTIKDLDVDKTMVGLLGSPTQVERVFMPEMKRRGEILEEEPEIAVQLLVGRLRQLGVM